MGDFDHKRDGASDEGASGGSHVAAGKQTLVQRRYGAVQRRRGDEAAGAPSTSSGGGGGGGGGAPLPSAVESKMSQSFGIDLSGVRVHEGGDAAAMGAQAYTQGTDIHFAPGRYDPHSAGGQELLGHELTHVVQQSQGRVASTTQAKGLAINDDAGLEREADVIGARAARGEQVDVGALGGHGAGSAQLKREPISPAGKNVLGLADAFFKATDTKVQAGKALKDAAGLLDVTGERNQELIAVVKKFAADEHTSDTVNCKSAFEALQLEIKAEGVQEHEARTQEAKEHGHALDRHGPEVSDSALARRLFTGIAPDNVLVPAPGASSRFNSYTDVMETRQKAAKDLATAIAAAAKHVLTWTTTEYPTLATLHSDAQKNTTDKTKDLSDKEKLKTDGFKDSKLSGTDKKQRLTDFQQAGKAKDKAVEDEATALDEKDNPGKSLKKVLASKTKLKLVIGDKAAPGGLEDGVTLAESYGITCEHGKPIGTGSEAKDTDAIRLKDVAAKVFLPANPPTTTTPTPKAKGDIINELTTLGVTTDLADLATFLADPANVDAVIKKGDKGAKIFKAVSDAGNLTKSYTNFKQGAGDALFDGSDAPLTIDTAGWDAIQHFPAPSGATEGVE
jgi:hypothetical protein